MSAIETNILYIKAIYTKMAFSTNTKPCVDEKLVKILTNNRQRMQYIHFTNVPEQFLQSPITDEVFIQT